MTRLTDDDKTFGPLTIGKSSWNPWRITWSSGGDGDDDRTRNSITVYAFGWVVRLMLPNILQPYRIRHFAQGWDAATVQRMGRDWYYETHPREYGFCLSDGHLSIYLGAQTGDSSSTQSWGCFLPWTQWRHIRFSLYDTTGAHFWTRMEGAPRLGPGSFAEQMEMTDRCPSVSFQFNDYDGALITARTHIEEREWRFGEGWFKWLSLFRRPKIRRSLDLRFSAEVGPEKGSWKGGSLGHGINMLPGELHEAAFKRYCEQEHRSKYRTFKIQYVRQI